MKTLTKILNTILIPYTILILISVFFKFDFPGLIYFFIGYFILAVIYILYIILGATYYLIIMEKSMRLKRIKSFVITFIIVALVNCISDYMMSEPLNWVILLHSFAIASLIAFWDLLFTRKPA